MPVRSILSLALLSVAEDNHHLEVLFFAFLFFFRTIHLSFSYHAEAEGGIPGRHLPREKFKVLSLAFLCVSHRGIPNIIHSYIYIPHTSLLTVRSRIAVRMR